MEVKVFDTKEQLGAAAAGLGADIIRNAISRNGSASIILATGASQFEMLDALVAYKDIDWTKVTAFHLDEYVGISESHPASFRRYLKERFVVRLAVPIGEFHYINAERDCVAESRRLGQIIRRHTTDAAFVGIGENAHLAFNDPPADFVTQEPYLVVTLDDACRQQQVGEGWFKTLENVPRQAISMSIRQIMKSRAIICSVPDGRKAGAVRVTLFGEISPLVPASILREHENCHLFLDKDSASEISV
ncbi:MAG: glucosamine-6-phosphate deaminase [Planctomycetota bacterium]|jgi:glucosamine-6-phosphate deaminase